LNRFLETSFTEKHPKTWARFRALARIAALLHDIGHGPLSHTTEFAMPPASSLKVPGAKKNQTRKANHEDYTLKIILDSELTPILESAAKNFGFTALHIAAVIDSHIEVEDSFFFEMIDNENINFRPILHQLISSELDADRMDYLRRDSIYAGVNYGQFDHAWIVSNLCAHIKDKNCYLALNHRALYAFEDFLLSRYNMFMMVYLHHKTVIYDEMLALYLNAPDCDYHLPSDIHQYLSATDEQLHSHLAQSSNEWARRIVEKKPYRMLIETHSGIPSTENAREQQAKVLKKVQDSLKTKEVHAITATSTGELSKYFGKSDFPIYVRYDNLYSAASFIPLVKCTNLFTHYPNSRTISRVFVSPEDYSKVATSGRDESIYFE
jgi:HD superfamily phosphohydrolase